MHFVIMMTFICRDFLEDNYALAKKYDADVVRYSRSYRTVKDGKVIAEEKTSFKAGVYSSSQFAANLIRSTKPEKESGPVFIGELFYRKIRLILMKP